MANASDPQALLEQNLSDAGCAPKMALKLMSLANERDTEAMLKLLSSYRRELLESVHANRKKIDCLDYLVYQINRNNA